MGSIELDLALQKKIEEFTVKARNCFQKKDFQGFEDVLVEEWDFLPEPKEKWEESFRHASMRIEFYIEDYIDFEKARKWLAILEQLDSVQQQHPGAVNIITGKIQYQEGLYQEAYQSFKKGFIESEGHCFGEYDKVYKSFYLKQGKV